MKNIKKINNTLKELGRTVGLSEIESLQAKRNTKNIIALAIVTGFFVLLGHILMPGGPVGLYYTGVSIKDFQVLFGGLF
jgi:hypothetical protein